MSWDERVEDFIDKTERSHGVVWLLRELLQMSCALVVGGAILTCWVWIPFLLIWLVIQAMHLYAWLILQ